MARMPKKPKKPRTSASVAAWERFGARMTEHHRKVAHIKSQKAKKAALIKKYASC